MTARNDPCLVRHPRRVGTEGNVVSSSFEDAKVLPFLLRRVGVAPAWVVQFAFAVWWAGLAALAATLWQLCRVVERWRLAAAKTLERV